MSELGYEGEQGGHWRPMNPVKLIYTWGRRSKAAGTPEFAVTRVACPGDPLIAEQPGFVCNLRVPGALDEDTGEKIEELLVQGEGPTSWEAKVSAANTAAEILSRYALWGARMVDPDPAPSLWGTVALALSDLGLHKDLELRNFVLLSQQRQAAGAPDADDGRASVPLTLLTHARLVRRWFGQHAAELPPHTSGDPYLMLGELLARRAREPEGGDNALLEAGLVASEGGAVITRLAPYFPPPEQYTVESEAWDPLPIAVRIPADPSLDVEEVGLDPGAGDLLGQMAQLLGAASVGRLVVWGRVGVKSTRLAGSEQEAAEAASAGRLVGQRHNRRPRPEPAATATMTVAAAPGGVAERSEASGPAAGEVFGAASFLGFAAGEEDDEPPAKRAARDALAAAAPGGTRGGAGAERPERGAPSSFPAPAVNFGGFAPAAAARAGGGAGPAPGSDDGGGGGGGAAGALRRQARGAAGGGGGGGAGGGSLSVRSLLVEGQHEPAAMDWAMSSGQEVRGPPQEAPEAPQQGAPSANDSEATGGLSQQQPPPQPPPATAAAAAVPVLPPLAGGGRSGRGGGRGRGRGGRGGRRFGGGEGSGGGGGANEIKTSEPTLYSLHGFARSPDRDSDLGGGGGDDLAAPFGAATVELDHQTAAEPEIQEAPLDEAEAAAGGGAAARLNVRASWLAGRPVWGDAVASLSRMTPTEIGHHIIRWRTYTRRDLDLSLAALFPASTYARARHLPVTARLPHAFRSINSWMGPSPMKLLSAYTPHHAWRGREVWELTQLPAASGSAAAAGAGAASQTRQQPAAQQQPAASEAGSVGSAAGASGGARAAAAAAGGPWVARLTVLPFGRDAPVVVESGIYLNQTDAQHAAALRALHLIQPLDAAALAGGSRLPGPPLGAPPAAAAGAAEAAARVAGEARAALLDQVAGAAGGGGAAPPGGAEGSPPVMVVEGEGGAAALGRGAAAAAAALAAAAEAPLAAARAAAAEAGGGAGPPVDASEVWAPWTVEVLHPGPEGGRYGEAGLVAKIDLRVTLPKEGAAAGAPPAAAAAGAEGREPSAGGKGSGGGGSEGGGVAAILPGGICVGGAAAAAMAAQRSAGGGGSWGVGGGEDGGFVVEQTGLASFSGLIFEIGTGAVVAPLEALVTALRPGGRGRVRTSLKLEGPDPLGLFKPRPAVITATLLSLSPPRPPLAAVAPAGAEEELQQGERGAGFGYGGRGGGGRFGGHGRGGHFGHSGGRSGRGPRDRGPDPLAALFEPSLRAQAAAVATGLVHCLKAESVVQIGGDSGALIGALLQDCAFTPLRRITNVDWGFRRLQRTAAAVEGALRASTVLRAEPPSDLGGGAAGLAAAASDAGAAAAAAQGASGEQPGAEGAARAAAPARQASLMSFEGSTVGGGSAREEGPLTPAPSSASQPPAAAAAAAEASRLSAIEAIEAAAAGLSVAAADGAWGAEVSALQCDIPSPSLAHPGAWGAAGLGECDVAVLSEAVEQLGGGDEAGAAVVRSVMGGLRPRVVLATTPNRSYNAILSELAGAAALRGPAGPGGAPLRHGPNRFEFTAPEFDAWARRVAAAGGYEVAVFGLGRARGDAATRAALAAGGGAAADAPAGDAPAGAADGAGDAAAAVEASSGGAGDAAGGAALAAAALAKEALVRGAPGGAPGGQEPLPGVGHAQLVALWVQRPDADAGAAFTAAPGEAATGAGVAAGLPAPLRQFWGPTRVVAVLPGGGELAGAGGPATAAPEAMEQF